MSKEPLAGAVEVIRPDFSRGRFRAVLFDFDGTLSLIRRNWPEIMIPMMVRELKATSTRETAEELRTHVEDYVMRLNGKQTIYQMMQLAEEVKARGGTPRDPLEYKHQYHELLWAQIADRVTGLKTGTIPPHQLTVPGAHALLDFLSRRGLTLVLASGTDLKYVRDEADALRVAEFFGEQIHGALDDYQNFSKAMIVQRIVQQLGCSGESLLGFGDGFVETQEIRRVGGVAVGVASNEETRQGVNAWKRNRLVQAGADIIVGDYRCLAELAIVLGLGPYDGADPREEPPSCLAAQHQK